MEASLLQRSTRGGNKNSSNDRLATSLRFNVSLLRLKVLAALFIALQEFDGMSRGIREQVESSLNIVQDKISLVLKSGETLKDQMNYRYEDDEVAPLNSSFKPQAEKDQERNCDEPCEKCPKSGIDSGQKSRKFF
jgi:hypothetical protein